VDEEIALGLNAEHIKVADERCRRRHFLTISLTLAAAEPPAGVLPHRRVMHAWALIGRSRQGRHSKPQAIRDELRPLE
jgi:hypothetical protein